MSSDLDRLGRAYERLAADTGARINFACDSDSEEALEIAEEERNFLDQAFFVLLFGALEHQLNQLAMARQNDGGRRATMRDAPFARRLDAAAKVTADILGNADALAIKANQIADWYELRNQIAHGESPTKYVDLAGLLKQAKSISLLLSEVQERLSSAGGS